MLPPLVSEVSNYPLKNNYDYAIPNTRLSVREQACIASVAHRWNALNTDIRNKQTIQTFKSALCTNLKQLPRYYIYGERKNNILHTRLRHQCSSSTMTFFAAIL